MEKKFISATNDHATKQNITKIRSTHYFRNEILGFDEEEEDDEEIKISPSGSVLVATVNPYNKADRIREANAALTETILAERPPGRVQFSKKIVSFHKNFQDIAVEDVEDLDEESDEKDEAPHSGMTIPKPLSVSLIPTSQISEEIASEESENEDLCFGNHSRRSSDISNSTPNTTRFLEKEIESLCQQFDEEREVGNCKQFNEARGDVIRELSRHLQRTISLNRDPDEESYSNSETENSGFVEEQLVEDSKQYVINSSSETNSECESNSTDNETKFPKANNENKTIKSTCSQSNVSCKFLKQSATQKTPEIIQSPPRLLSTELYDLHSRNYCNHQMMVRPQSCFEKKRSALETERPSTAPSRRICSPAWKPDKLPQYNGLRSEYGLSAQQLQERRRHKIERAKFLKIRRQQKSREEEEKKYENNLIFSSWLARKRREASEKVLACNRLTNHFQYKTLPAPTAHLEKTRAVRKKELKPRTTFCTLHDFLAPQKPKDKKTYRIYLGVSVE